MGLSISLRFCWSVITIALLLYQAQILQSKPHSETHQFGPFNYSYYQTFQVVPSAGISNGALQVTPDSSGNFTLTNNSGRVLFDRQYKLWEDGVNGKVVSFSTSFLINIYRVNESVPAAEGLAFVIAPDAVVPSNSYGKYLGLTNSTTDGNPNNHFVAVELDTFKQDFDPDDNHIGLDINSVVSKTNVSLDKFGIKLAPVGTKFYVVWIQYDGSTKVLYVYIAEQPDRNAPTVPRPDKHVLKADLDLKAVVKQSSYFGFAASTGNFYELNCVLKWNLTVEILPGDDGNKNVMWIALGIGLPTFALLLLGVGGFGYYLYRKGLRTSEPNILGALKILPGVPREFTFKDLNKATQNFDDKNKLGEGGFGVVYKGVLPKEKLEIAVKKFSRDDIKSKDDFLAELTIINRLRHKHLVRLLGWCHKTGGLLLVYEFMPNGSLDTHLFTEPGRSTRTISWEIRYKIISGVASALHYLHDEYDQKVVHRDLKASNIMLDSHFNARLGDFGLARALEHEKTSYAELSGVPGTIGYIAPECFHTGKATCESDVYGFGAVLLEVVCGQRPWTNNGGFQFLVDYVWYLHRDGRILEAVDKRLENEYVVEEAERLLLLGLACCHPSPSDRPKSQEIVQMISGSVSVPHIPPFKPSFVWPSTPVGSYITDFTSRSSDATPTNTSSFQNRCIDRN